MFQSISQSFKLLAFLTLALLSASTEAAERPNILLINAEDMSPHLGCYGDPQARTPNIDRLAASGVVYEQAFSTAPICSPSRSCLATGLYATSLGTQHLRCEVEIPERVVPLAVRMKKLGYFCTNTGKSDYNFDPSGIWDAWNTDPAPWNARAEKQPFFSFMTIGQTHEGRINYQERYEEATADVPEALRHDPAQVKLPPFFPDTPETRRIFANMYDLATVFDLEVGEVLDRLEADGDLENTVVFIFADHGNGLPRYKRWLNDSGLRVPLVVYVPPKFRALCPTGAGTKTNRLVSFVDFPITALSLAGAQLDKPEYEVLQGEPFLGNTIAEPRKFVYGARSRADDMFEVSRSVFDGRYLYVRHFLPHLPYIQPGVIFSDNKRSYRELRRLHEAGQLNEHAEQLWSAHKPLTELYDLQNDPYELDNLAGSADVAEVQNRLAAELRRWILAARDSGFMPEAEYQIRAKAQGVTPFDIVQDPQQFELEATLDAASRVGDLAVPPEKLIDGLKHQEAAVRYWSAVGLEALAALGKVEAAQQGKQQLRTALADESPSVRIAAAQALVEQEDLQPALQTLGEVLQDDRPQVALQAARAVALLGKQAKPLLPIIKEVRGKNLSEPGSRRPYKDFNYASFTGWALEWALSSCGEPIKFTQ